jgi:hypothetical protein
MCLGSSITLPLSHVNFSDNQYDSVRVYTLYCTCICTCEGFTKSIYTVSAMLPRSYLAPPPPSSAAAPPSATLMYVIPLPDATYGASVPAQGHSSTAGALETRGAPWKIGPVVLSFNTRHYTKWSIYMKASLSCVGHLGCHQRGRRRHDPHRQPK